MDASVLSQLRSTGLFASVDPQQLEGLTGEMRSIALMPGVVLFDQGAIADEIYVVCAGTLEVVSLLKSGGTFMLGELGPGSVVGEIAVLTGDRRTAQVRAVTEATVVAVTAAGFDRLLNEHPEIGAEVIRAATERLQRTQLTTQVVQHLGLDDLAAVAEIAKLLDWVRLGSGEWLFHEGDEADAAYLVASGRLRVVVTEGDHEEAVAELGRGELVGEMALIEGGVRNASVVATRDTQLVRFPASSVSLILERFPSVFLHLTRTILRRARRPTSQRHAEEQVSIAVVPLTAQAQVRELCGRLADALGSSGEVARLWSDRIDMLLGREGISQSTGADAGDVRLVPWLHEVEDRSRFVLYEADAEWTPWTDRVLRQCDRVLLVADAAASAAVGALEAEVWRALAGRRRPRTSLVLVHDSSTSLPSGTAAWLTSRPVDEVHHLRRGVAGDVGRLGRVLAGTAVSLVLSGGGARGFAQLGVIRAMHELGIPIDLVAGTSIGSVIATTAAMDFSDEEAVRRTLEGFSNIMDWTVPIVSVLRGRRISRRIVDLLGGIDIEDLWLPYLCISASLTRARPVVHKRGPLAMAVRASVAIPGVLPPVPTGDELLVDGGVIDNLPVSEMRRMNPTGPLIAVDVAPPSERRPVSDYGLSISGLEALRLRLASRGRARLPSLSGTVLGSMLIASTRDRDRVIEDGLADLYLPVDASGCGPFEWDAVARVADKGYRSARPVLEEWMSTRPSG